MSPWTPASAPRLDGQVAVVTGANSGLGLHTTHVLAARGAHVVMACRNADKAQAARQRVLDAVPEARLEVRALDLADLSSVRAFASDLDVDRLDLLVNNAGIMAIPRRTTADGFEMQLGTNHLGHFALTGLLIDRLLDGGGRVVTVSSMAHQMGRFTPHDMMGARRYDRWRQYGLTKLCNLLFHYELARRLAAADAPVLSLAAHPGYADTNLQYVGPQMDGSMFTEWFYQVGNAWIAQPGEQGAEPQLRACLDPDARNGDFFGPDGWFQVRGHATHVKPGRHALSRADQAALWAWSEDTTGVRFDALPAAA